MQHLVQNPEFIMGMASGALAVAILLGIGFLCILAADHFDPESAARDRADKITFDRLVDSHLQRLATQGLPASQQAAAHRKAKAQAANWPRHGDRAVEILRYDLGPQS